MLALMGLDSAFATLTSETNVITYAEEMNVLLFASEYYIIVQKGLTNDRLVSTV